MCNGFNPLCSGRRRGIYRMQTIASGAQMTVSVESPTVGKDDEVKVLVTASSGEAMSYIKADLTYDAEKLELVGTSTDLATRRQR